MILCFYHVTYHIMSCHIQIESTFYICLNVKELLSQNKHPIWCLSDCKGTLAHNYLVCKQTLNHLARLAKWLSCFMSTYLYSAFDCKFLSCHVCVSEWIHILYLPECQKTLCLTQAPYLKFKWLQQDSNPQPISL